MPTFGSGLGHATRMASVANGLKSKGLSVHFSSFKEGLDYLTQSGYPCDSVSPIDVAWSAEGHPSVGLTLQRIPKMFARFSKHVKLEAQRILKLRPKVIFSDSRLSPIIAATLLGLPSLSLLNQIRVLLPKHGILRLAEQAGAEIFGQLWGLSREILIPDLSPPYTIASKNVGRISSVGNKMRYVGYISSNRSSESDKIAKIRKSLEIDGRKQVFFAQISGPSGTKERLIAEISRAVSERFVLIISGGMPGGLTEPVRIGNSWFFEWCPIRDELFEIADYALIRGGHSTITKSISLGKPMLVLPIPNHTEQIGNAERVEELGLGIYLRSNDISGKTLIESMEMIASNDSYKSKVDHLKKISSEYDAVATCVEKISEAYEK